MGTRMKAAWPLLLCIALLPEPSSSLAQSEDLATKSQRAKEFMAEGKFAEAIPLYSELNHALPNNPGLLLNLGMALHMAGDERKSIPQLEAAVKLDPKLGPAWLFLGAARLQLGDALEAVEPLRAVLRLQPDHQEARLMLAGALLSLERNAEAAQEYRKLADLSPASSPAWYGLGRSYEALSIRAFHQLEKTAPESAYWLALVAEARLRQQQFTSAFYLYRRALENSPAMRGLHEAVAEIYRQTGHPDWASVEEEKERKLSPPDCHSHTFECDFQEGHFERVIAAATEANPEESYYWRSRAYNELALNAFARLGQMPPSAEQHEIKAHIYSSQKKYIEAAEEWRQALKFSPGDRQIREQLAISLKFSQDYGGALLLFQDLLRTDPESTQLNYLVGDTLLELQRVEEATPFLRQVVARDPKSQAAHKSLARAYLAAGKSADAIPHLKAALATDEDGSLHYELGRAYQAHGQLALARQMLSQYQEIHSKQEAEKQSLNQEMQITPPDER